jgi:hypothetical protein
MAAPPAASAPLWDRVEFGQTVEKLRLLYPPSSAVKYEMNKVVIATAALEEKCPGAATIFLEEGKVESVSIQGEAEMLPKCLGRVRRFLRGQYGKPKSSLGDLTWRAGEVCITLGSRQASGDPLNRAELGFLTERWFARFARCAGSDVRSQPRD